jgi:hypothetical protein
MLAAESAGVVHDEAVSKWFQKYLPTSPSERRGEVWGFCRIPGWLHLGGGAG